MDNSCFIDIANHCISKASLKAEDPQLLLFHESEEDLLNSWYTTRRVAFPQRGPSKVMVWETLNYRAKSSSYRHFCGGGGESGQVGRHKGTWQRGSKRVPEAVNMVLILNSCTSSR